jgi:hypothetical protein
MKVSEIQVTKPFNQIFPVEKKVLTAVIMSMRKDGYDEAHPVIVWKGKGVVVDGHTRLEAARLVGIEDVPVVERDFSDEDEAVRYAIHCQRDRRNLTDADIVRLVEELDKRKGKGARTDLASSEATSTGKSAEDTAKVIGTSRAKVEKARTVKAKATPDVQAAVAAGDMTLNKAYQTTRKPKASTPAKASTEPTSTSTICIAPEVRGDDDEAVEKDESPARGEDPANPPDVPTWCKYVLYGYCFARDKRDVKRMQEAVDMHVVRVEDRRKGKK